MSVDVDVTAEVHTRDSLLYAQTIHHGLRPRERQALAAVLDNMPCSVSAVSRAAAFSRRTAQRACDALEAEQVGLVERTEDGLAIHPDAIGGVEAWADHYGHRSGAETWWADPSYADAADAEASPDDEFSDPSLETMAEVQDVELAVRTLEHRRVPTARGTFIPFAVLEYVSVTHSLQAARVAVECGRRVDRQGVAAFGRGELAMLTGLSSHQVSNTLARIRSEGIATSAISTRIELNLRWRQGGGHISAPSAQEVHSGVTLSPETPSDLQV